MLTADDGDRWPRAPTRSLLGFARALRAAGVPVTQDRAARLPRGRAPRRPRRPAGDVLGRPGHALRRARRPRPATTRSSTAYFDGRDGLPRAAARATAGAGARPALPDADERRRPARPTTTPRSSGRRPATPRCCGTATSPTLTGGREAPARRDVRALRPRPPRRGVPPGTSAGTAARSTPRAPCARRCAGWASPAEIALAPPRRPAAPGGAAGRRVRLDERVRRRAAAARAPVHGRPRRPRRRSRCSPSAPGSPTSPARCGSRDPERALVAAGETVPDWSGGTRLGETLRVFLDRWGQRGMARGAVVVIFSDGWERGDPTLLGEQMARLHRIAHRVVWVNPHRGKAGYEPVQQGVRRRAAALSTTSSPVTRWRRSRSCRR